MTVQRVLYVEDDPDIRQVAQIAPEVVVGLATRLCGSGYQAVQEAGEFAPDVILLDVMMPDMDGPATLHELRTQPALSAVPIIFLTAKTSDAERSELMALGAVAVIPKPFDPMTLAQQVRDVWAAQQEA